MSWRLARTAIALAVVVAASDSPAPGLRDQAPAPSAARILAIQGDRFTIDGTPRFLLMVSMFDAVRAAAALDRLRSDLDFVRHTVKADGIRVFPNWWDYSSGRPSPSADALFDPGRPGTLRPEVRGRLIRVLDEASARGLVIDVTFTRETFRKPDGTFMSVAEYKRSLVETANVLARYSNVLVDVQNEFNCSHPGQHLSDTEAGDLVRAVRTAHPTLPVAASVACSIAPAAAAAVAKRSAFSFVAFHDDRVDGRWHASARIRGEVADLRSGTAGRLPVYFQEPERWDHAPVSAHFTEAAVSARQHGAAAWTFHTRAGFDLRRATFSSRLERTETRVLRGLRPRLDATAAELKLP